MYVHRCDLRASDQIEAAAADAPRGGMTHTPPSSATNTAVVLRRDGGPSADQATCRSVYDPKTDSRARMDSPTLT